MDEQERARLAILKHRQARAHRIPVTLEAWRSLDVPATALSHERSEQLIEWLRATWRQPDQLVGNLDRHLQLVTESLDAVLVTDFWQWDEAVTVLVPACSLVNLKYRLLEIYPDGFLAADQLMTKGLIVNFDGHADGAEMAQIGYL